MSETFSIYRWDTGEVIASADGETLKEALQKLVSDGKDLYRASLDGASLDRARLVGASLVGARLDGASLVGARLVGASLDRARLVGARLDGASLDGASLVGASLVGARLDRARLDPIKHDLWGILLHVPKEISGLVSALKEGRVDGSVYEGKCACLVGTIANVRGCAYCDIPGVTPDGSRPAEVWFLAIAKGDTAQKNPIVQITLDWIAEFEKLRMGAA